MIVFLGKWDPSCNQMDAWAHLLSVSRYVLCTWHSVLCLSTYVPMSDFLILLVWIGNLCDYCQLVCLLELPLYLGYSNQSGISIISGYISCCQPCMHTVSDRCSKGTCDFIAASVKHDGCFCHWSVSGYTIVSGCILSLNTVLVFLLSRI